MSRLRGRWLDDDDDRAPAVEEPPPVDDDPPWVPLETNRPLRGHWLPDEATLPPVPTGDGSQDGDPVEHRVHETPKWTGPAVGVASFAFVVLAFFAILGNTNVARALIVAPVLYLVASTLGQRLAKIDGQPAVAAILVGGLAVKFCGVLLRYWISLQVYGRSDATEYANWGRLIAAPLRHGELIDIGRLRGTNFIRLVTGIVFAVTPASDLVGFFVFGFFSWVGMIFFWRALKRAMPNIDDLRYLQILMLMPSLAYWPSSIGKEGWMVMCVGLASYGVANILTNRTVLGWGCFLLGIYGVLAVRPHVGIGLFAGLVLAELFRSRGSQGATRAGLSLVLLFFIGGTVMSTAAAFLGIENWSKASVDQELGDVGDRTSEGRSEFTPTPVNSPAQFPQGAFTVLLRPMPYETHSPQEFASAIENVVFAGVLLWSLPRLLGGLRRSRQRPYLLYCVGAITVFVVEYSSFSNFALIARQRTQITALLLVFVCLPREKTAAVDTPTVRAAPRSVQPGTVT